jgi:hypothetical protein
MASADRHGLAPEARLIALLHGRIEGVHVDMDDFPDGAVGIGHE